MSTLPSRLVALFVTTCLLLGALTTTAQRHSVAQPAASPRAAGVALSFDHYYTVAEIEQAMRQLAADYPTLCTLESMGLSYEGRELWVMTVTNAETGPASDKTAMYIDGNTHGNEIDASEVSLYTIAYLCAEHGKDPFVTWLLDKRAFYIAPCVNPDGRANFMEHPNTPHSSRRVMRPDDADGDGEFDEDPPNDLDGDGNIVQMRRVNPDGRGEYRISYEDPRIMERVNGERRAFDAPMFGPDPNRNTVTYDYWRSEGFDDDGDGRINEDDRGGVDPNRNFPTFWEPHHKQWGAGEYPLSEPETRATVDYISVRPNIAAVQSYHNSGSMVLRGPGPAEYESLIPREDGDVFDLLGRAGEAIIEGGYRYLVVYRDLYTVYGGFLDWGYFGLGVISFTNELWHMPFDYDKNGSTSGAERLRWNDEVLKGDGFVDWHEVDHPTLGKVELGGWTKWAQRNPPVWMLTDTCHRNCLFTLHHAASMPEVAVMELSSSAVDGVAGLWRVRARFENKGLIPTITGRGQRIGATRPDEAIISGEGVTVIATGREVGQDGATQSLRLDALDNEVRDVDPARVEIPRLGPHGETEVEWLVRAEAGATITVQIVSVKGGRAEAEHTIGE